MAAAGTNSLKRTARELDVDTAPGAGEVELAEAFVKRPKTEGNKFTFMHKLENLILTVRTEHESLSRSEKIAGYVLAIACGRYPKLNAYSVEALAQTSSNRKVSEWRREAIEALDSGNERLVAAVELDASTMLAQRLRKKVLSARPHKAVFYDPKIFGDPLGYEDPWLQAQDGFEFFDEPFFQGKKLVLKPSEATSDDEEVSVPLGEDGICTLQTFVNTVCGLKINKPYDDKDVFTVSSIKALQAADGEDEGSAVAFYEWDSE